MQLSKMPAIRAATMMASMLAAAGAARADGGFNTTITGYGTVGGAMTSDSNYQFVHDGSEFKGASNTLNIGLESRIGVQAQVDFGSNISVTVQELAKERGAEDFKPGTEWAFVQYAATPDFKIRLGRMALGTFLISDSRNVGYAQPWFDAPNEVYAAQPFTYIDGGQVLWHVNMGPAGLDLQSAYGTTGQNIQTGGLALTINVKYVFNASAALTYKNLTLRIAETTTALPFTIPLSPTFAVTYEDIDKFYSVGAEYDDGKFLVLSEWTKRSENKAPVVELPLSQSTAWYVAGGYRFGKLTPLLMYGKINNGVGLLSPTTSSDSTPAASLRYDIARNIALKAQFSRPKVSDSTYMADPNAASTARVSVYSLGADFVF
jgi:hypothetical protein